MNIISMYNLVNDLVSTIFGAHMQPYIVCVKRRKREREANSRCTKYPSPSRCALAPDVLDDHSHFIINCRCVAV